MCESMGMPVIELLPLQNGNRLVLDETTVTTIGRTPNIGCLDKKISRNHAELRIKSDGTLWIKPVHHNPTFYRTKSKQLITLTKDEEFQLNDNDEIGLLPNDYFYRISITSKQKPEDKIDSSTMLKSPEKSIEKEKSPPKDQSLEQEGGVILHTARSLPSWMSTNNSSSETKSTKGRNKSKSTPTTTPAKTTPSPSKYRTYIGRKKADNIVYDDDDDNDDDDTNNQSKEAKSETNTDKKNELPAKRERCPYGKFCYRKNPIHRQEAIHPGDPDWNNKENDTNNAKPECPYGAECYRTNPNHFKEYNHNKISSKNVQTKQRASKRKASDNDDEDDDDGLPNEYDYNDSFIDDEDLDDSARVDRHDTSNRDPDMEWEPHKKAGAVDHDDNDESNSSDESEINLLKKEATEFIQSTSTHDRRLAKKKARTYVSDNDD